MIHYDDQLVTLFHQIFLLWKLWITAIVLRKTLESSACLWFWCCLNTLFTLHFLLKTFYLLIGPQVTFRLKMIDSLMRPEADNFMGSVSYMCINSSINLLVTEQSSWLCLESFLFCKVKWDRKCFLHSLVEKKKSWTPGADGVIIMKSLM